jgi:starch synthase
LGLPQEWYGALGWVFPTWARTHALDTGEAVNFLKGAIVTSDRIVTVSKVINTSYHLQILNHPPNV